MNRLTILIATIFISVCAMAQQKAYIRFNDGRAIECSIEDIKEIGFEKQEGEIIVEQKEALYPVPAMTYVDMNLSVKWATCNIGASKPSEPGYFFGWGELTPQMYKQYNWASYLKEFGAEIQSADDCGTAKDPMKEYILGGIEYERSNDIGAVEFDMAHERLGGYWKMPSKREVEELMKMCDWEWMPEGNSEYDGVAGWKVISDNGFSVQSIFFPAVGYYEEGEHQGNGSGYYWTSTPSKDNKHEAIMFQFDGSSKQLFGSERYRGFVLRPVYTDVLLWNSDDDED